ncbi:hypothetical protein AU192_19800 [Mycobacterium lehmannii]|uniref:Uncharacterized protein n=1 Tax=Mycobacterium lehmannii TaxID=2048550 RepID=A0A101A3J2_9MYCO|nr:hypothetical protein AU192_19800 [Mycobacterium lehmannii]
MTDAASRFNRLPSGSSGPEPAISPVAARPGAFGMRPFTTPVGDQRMKATHGQRRHMKAAQDVRMSHLQAKLRFKRSGLSGPRCDEDADRSLHPPRYMTDGRGARRVEPLPVVDRDQHRCVGR